MYLIKGNDMPKKIQTTLNLSEKARKDLADCAEVYAESNWSRMVTEWAKRGAARIKMMKWKSNANGV